ncbi:YfzA family protein [Shouchella lonarensis]|uniref:YfzA-like protein n=1 Tax=Shouchella lonarensis TaxID=1464122 RepID=A0A1G6NCQ8_9BACI|nr:YfzA family protein [Shouchella lonarensis]SDC64965.1 YfzA-like protein [Shouchella lonarensis]
MADVNQKVDHDDGRLSWFIWLGLFVLVQFIFAIIEHFSWPLLGANRFGDQLAHFIQLEEWFTLHQSTGANLVTLIWGALLLLNGISRIVNKT